MNRHVDSVLPATGSARHPLFPLRTISRITLIQLHIFVPPPRLNQALTTIGKDARASASRATVASLARPKPIRVRIRCVDGAPEAATENRHGPKSRAQAARTDHYRFLRGHQPRSARPIADRRRQDSDSARE